MTQNGDIPGISFPRVPGHEIAGRVVSRGPNVRWPPKETMVGIVLFVKNVAGESSLFANEQ